MGRGLSGRVASRYFKFAFTYETESTIDGQEHVTAQHPSVKPAPPSVVRAISSS